MPQSEDAIADCPTILGRRQSTKSWLLHLAHVGHRPSQVGSRSGLHHHRNGALLYIGYPSYVSLSPFAPDYSLSILHLPIYFRSLYCRASPYHPHSRCLRTHRRARHYYSVKFSGFSDTAVYVAMRVWSVAGRTIYTFVFHFSTP